MKRKLRRVVQFIREAMEWGKYFVFIGKLPCPALRPNTSQDTHEDIRMCKINDTPVLHIDIPLCNRFIMYEKAPATRPACIYTMLFIKWSRLRWLRKLCTRPSGLSMIITMCGSGPSGHKSNINSCSLDMYMSVPYIAILIRCKFIVRRK